MYLDIRTRHLQSDKPELVLGFQTSPPNSGQVHRCWDFVYRSDVLNRKWKGYRGMNRTGREAGIAQIRAVHAGPSFDRP